MTTPSRTSAENALAQVIRAIRPDWDTPGILSALRSRPMVALDQVAAAALWATTRTDQHTPHLIAEDNGEALDRLLGKQLGPPTPMPTRNCWTHPDQPRGACADCAAQARTVATPDRVSQHIAQAKAAIRAANRKDEQ